VGGEPVAIGRDAAGVYAMSLICTHEQCDMTTDGSVAASGVTCSCHGSRFDRNGGVTAGPASKPLPHYEVEIDMAGEITIHGGSEVSAATRVAVPA
jgi:Rieske Fe-S protein